MRNEEATGYYFSNTRAKQLMCLRWKGFSWQYEIVRDDALNRGVVFTIDEREVHSQLARHSFFFFFKCKKYDEEIRQKKPAVLVLSILSSQAFSRRVILRLAQIYCIFSLRVNHAIRKDTKNARGTRI